MDSYFPPNFPGIHREEICHICKFEVGRWHRFRRVNGHMMHEECFHRRILNLCAIGFLIFVLAVALSHAETFPLGKPLNEIATVCLEKEAAVNLAKAAEKSPQEFEMLLQLYFNFHICGNIQASITYSNRVHQSILQNGVKLNVYEGKTNGVTVYNITDWTHIENRI